VLRARITRGGDRSPPLVCLTPELLGRLFEFAANFLIFAEQPQPE
jgi:hypothetical protein